MNHQEIAHWLREDRPEQLESLWLDADRCRRDNVGDAVHLRGLIEISNRCVRSCLYCGLRAGNSSLGRYRMSADEILDAAAQAVQFGYGTVVLQSGEDPGLEAAWLADIIRQIKSRTPLAVTLSLGERADEELALWRSAGADRYLLRFETSNRRLYDYIHPPVGSKRSDRFEILRRLRELGYEIGSGVMIGIPGQTYDDLANDIEAFAAIDLEMIGAGPFLPHPQTPLGKETEGRDSGNSQLNQVPATELMTYKVVALARLVCPQANIPSTTALATLNRANGRELGLMRGANIVMPNLTPVKYRALYEIYRAKACIYESASDCHNCLRGRIASIGRTVGRGRGDSPSILRKLSPKG